MATGVKSISCRVRKDYLPATANGAVQIISKNLIVSIVKCCEKNDGIIIRVCNMSEDEEKGIIRCCKEIKKEQYVNMNEELIGNAEFAGKEVRLMLKLWKVKTLNMFF